MSSSPKNVIFEMVLKREYRRESPIFGEVLLGE